MNVRPESIRVLEGSTGSELLDTHTGNEVLDLTLKAKKMKAKINKWDYIELKSLCTTNKPSIK